MKRILIATAVVICLFLVIAGVVVHRWASTPYGRLDYRTAVLLKLSELSPHPKDLSEVKVAELREWFEKRRHGRMVSLPKVEDRRIPGPAGEILVRIYYPPNPGPLPVIVYYHGGGWVVGSIGTHDVLTRYLAKTSGAIVVSADYRLAQEHPFPAAVEDTYAALQWVSREASTFGGDPDEVFVAGDSAGGNLAAVVCLKAKDLHGPGIRGQVLLYPATNLSSLDTPSIHHFGKGYFLTKEAMEWLISRYVPEPQERTNPYVSPLLARDLGGLPPALVITAQFDPLRDEGEAYGERLREAGVPAEVVRFPGMIHGFARFVGLLPQAEEALDRVGAWIEGMETAGTGHGA